MALVRLEITKRKPFADGQVFGHVGRYEQIDGLAHFAVDPSHPDNTVIADIALAPRTTMGRWSSRPISGSSSRWTTTTETAGCCWTC